jgi:hypothetical protein
MLTRRSRKEVFRMRIERELRGLWAPYVATMALLSMSCATAPDDSPLPDGAAPSNDDGGSPDTGSPDSGAGADAPGSTDSSVMPGSDSSVDSAPPSSPDSSLDDAPMAHDAPMADAPIDAGSAALTPIWTNRYNSQRTGATTVETQITQAAVERPGGFGLLYSRTVDGTIQAQPLYIPGLTIQGSTHNVIFVATFHNSVYAFDADDPAQSAPLWTVNLGPSAPASSTIFQCADIQPEIGIASTPVIDAQAGTMYVVAKTLEAGAYHQRLHALDILTGMARAGSPVDIAATAHGSAGDGDGGVLAVNQMTQLQRAGLLLEKGVVYLAFSSHCDIRPYYHGWVLAYDAASLHQLGAFVTTPDGNRGGIWQSGFGVSTDGDGVFVSPGNGDVDPSGAGKQVGESVVRLKLGPTGLALADFWTPANAVQFTGADLDITSGFLVGPGNLGFQGAKTGRVYVLDRTNLGGYHTTGDRIVQTVFYKFNVPAGTGMIGGGPAAGGAGHLHGSPVYWEGPAGGRLFIWPEEGPLQAFAVDPSAASNPVNPSAVGVNGTVTPAHPGGMVTASSNGATAGSGVVWASLAKSGTDAWHALVSGYLYAFSADDVTRMLWSSEGQTQDSLGLFAKFCPPTVANGRLYIGTAIDTNTKTAFLRVYGPLSGSAQNRSYTLVNHATGWAVDVKGGATTAGAPVIQWPITGGPNQKWQMQFQGTSSFVLVNANSNMVLDVPGASVVAGTAVDQAARTGAANQQWTFEPAATAGYFVVTSNGGNVALASPSGTQDDPLAVKAPDGSAAQEWKFVPAP